VALVTGRDGKIKALHGFKKLRGTRTRPDMKLVCLLGSGARANGIVIDTGKITKLKEIPLPRADFLWECSTIDKLANVKNKMVPSSPTTPSATVQQSNQRRSNPKIGGEETRNTTHIPIKMVTYNKTMCFVPLPFILNQFF
jgi:hypothetical protein